MNINIKATNMELTDAISDYVNKRLASIEKFARGGEVTGFVEVGKTTNHHKQGDVYKAEFDINLNGEKFFAKSEQSDLYAAIDDAKEEIARSVTHNKDRKQTLFKRGASSVKKMLKGLSDRNPFTSKY
ncbi:MAG: ribosome-associated translation inhibitor RaiA [Patescibacteria group bacterium]